MNSFRGSLLQGCVDGLKDLIAKYNWIIFGVAIGIAALEVFFHKPNVPVIDLNKSLKLNFISSEFVNSGLIFLFPLN